MSRNFDEWISNFRESIADYKYYVDFQKVYKNVDEVKVELNILNTLIGSKNIEEEFKSIVKKYPEVMECIPLILAVREKELHCQDENGSFKYKFNYGEYLPNNFIFFENLTYFMRETGLFDLLQNHIINNLYDYVLGIEVGLDSNGRKNRGGHLMENLVEDYIVKAGFKKDVNYFKEMYLTDIENKWNLDLSAMSGNNVSTKRFDFVIKTDNQVYVIETNFYASSGSKLNETARSYKMLAAEAKKIEGVTFVWFTDGIGWYSARKNLEETFNELETIYNIYDLENGILNNL